MSLYVDEHYQEDALLAVEDSYDETLSDNRQVNLTKILADRAYKVAEDINDRGKTIGEATRPTYNYLKTITAQNPNDDYYGKGSQYWEYFCGMVKLGIQRPFAESAFRTWEDN